MDCSSKFSKKKFECIYQFLDSETNKITLTIPTYMTKVLKF